MRPRVNPDLCMGHGRCYDLAPTVFEADETGHARVAASFVAASEEENARLAEQNCPEGAITLES